MVCLPSTAINSKRKISQMEFDAFYLESLEDSTYYRNKDGGLDLPTFLETNDYLPNLSGLNLRHRNFCHATFSGISLDSTDLIGSRCHSADFTHVDCTQIIIDASSQFHGAQLTPIQLLQLQTRAATNTETQATSAWAKESKQHTHLFSKIGLLFSSTREERAGKEQQVEYPSSMLAG